MMKETNIQPQVTSTIAGDDGEAVAKSEENAKKKVPEKPNEGLEKPADAGWYVAVVRVNCETKAQFGGQRFGEMEVWAIEAFETDRRC